MFCWMQQLSDSWNIVFASVKRYGNDNFLIFPSLIKQKRPLQDDVPSTDDISYIVRGRVENIYAMMVVLLGYTPSFYSYQPMGKPGTI